VALILLTNQPDMESAYGAARRFWSALRDRYGELTYFCWLELTRAGLPHYHAMLVNPPAGFFSADTKHWLERQWGNRFVKLHRRDADWFTGNAGRYVGSYAKKFGVKDYQQDYESVPTWLRTFMSNRLEHSAGELAEHDDKWEATYVSDQVDAETHRVVEPYIALGALRRHVCPPGGGIRYVSQKGETHSRLAGGQGAVTARSSADYAAYNIEPSRRRSFGGSATPALGPAATGVGVLPVDVFLAGPLLWRSDEQQAKRTPGAKSFTGQAPGVEEGGRLCHPAP
jgi:hypothetical protein